MIEASANKKADRSFSDSDAAAQVLIALIDEFIVVVNEENGMLASGLPAPLSPVAKRKNELADTFEKWTTAASERAFRIEATTPAVRTKFVESLKVFQRAMNENVTRLEAAMIASQRRIDAVMAVIRDEVSNTSSYGVNGRIYKVGGAASLRSGYV